MISNYQELVQSEQNSCPENQNEQSMKVVIALKWAISALRHIISEMSHKQIS